jgi:hypothetical protein
MQDGDVKTGGGWSLEKRIRMYFLFIVIAIIIYLFSVSFLISFLVGKHACFHMVLSPDCFIIYVVLVQIFVTFFQKFIIFNFIWLKAGKELLKTAIPPISNSFVIMSTTYSIASSWWW